MDMLNKISEKNPFKVPENYFDDVNTKILSATSGYTGETGKVSFYNKYRSYLLIAASVTGFIILSYTAIRLLNGVNISKQLSEIVNEDYTELYLNDIDILTLEENAASVMFSEEGTGVSKKVLVDYLLLEDIEFNDIYERL